LENQFFNLTQGNLTIRDYFTKVKSLNREISELDPEEKIGETKLSRKIIHGLRHEYQGFITSIQDCPVQPTLGVLENLLANQETLAKQMASMTIKSKEEALYCGKRR
jgi:hypothetical protein